MSSKNENSVAIIFGASGETGRELLKLLLNSKDFSRVVVVTRKPLDLLNSPWKSMKPFMVVSEDVRNFDQSDLSPNLTIDVAFCCIGTSLTKVLHAEFEFIERDLIVELAEKSKRFGCQNFHLVSGFMSHPESRFFISRIKGECEEALKTLGFHQLTIYRPGLLRCQRRENRFWENLARNFADFFDQNTNYFSIHTKDLARMIIKQSLQIPKGDGGANLLILEHSDIVKLLYQ